MLRLSELKLPLDHSDGELRAAILAALGIDDGELLAVSVFKRSHDARKKDQILLIYHLDLTLAEGVEAEVLARHPNNPHIGPSPDTRYNPVARAPAEFPARGEQRPLIAGLCPRGLPAALVLAPMVITPPLP